MSLSDNEALFLKDKKIIPAWNITIALFEGHISHCHCFLFLRYFIERVTVVLVSFLMSSSGLTKLNSIPASINNILY